MTNTAQTPTPGFNRRIAIFFGTDKNGNRRAYRWSPMQLRSFPMALATAELLVATDAADLLDRNPMAVER